MQFVILSTRILSYILLILQIGIYEPFAANLIINNIHPAVLVNGIICQMHEHVRNILTGRFLVLARRKSESVIFLTFYSMSNVTWEINIY